MTLLARKAKINVCINPTIKKFVDQVANKDKQDHFLPKIFIVFPGQHKKYSTNEVKKKGKLQKRTYSYFVVHTYVACVVL